MGALAIALVGSCFVGGASAQLSGDFTVFQQCPVSNPLATKCFDLNVTGGEFSVGTRTVPIVSPIDLQGGITAPHEGTSAIVPAANGATLSAAPQPVPGGLFNIVPPKKAPPLVRGLVEAFAASGLNRVTATLEPAGGLAGLSSANLLAEAGVAFKLPVKVHLENRLLGKACFVGSDAMPIDLEFTTGTTDPPPPNLPITGGLGSVEFRDEGRLLQLSGLELVDNSWSAPAAQGCGERLHALIDPVINSQLGLPSAAGHNGARLVSTLSLASVAAVEANNAENP